MNRCYLPILALLLWGNPRTASSADEAEKKHFGSQITDFFSSLYGNNKDSGKETGPSTIQLSADQLSAFFNQFQQFQKTTGSSDKKGHHGGKSNRRKALYNLSVRAHYESLLHEQQQSTNVSSSLNAASCEYFNDGMHSKSGNIRDMAKEENILSRCSHWTFRLCPKKSIAQMHLEPSAITEGGDDESTLKLPPNSLLAKSIQFNLPTVHDLGTYLPPGTPGYETIISAAWGAGENESTMPKLVEYYTNGDLCKGPGNKAKKRQAKVVYDNACCNRTRQSSMMEQFFLNDGSVMIRSTTEPEPCRYVLNVCKVCPPDTVMGGNSSTLGPVAKEASHSADSSKLGQLVQTLLQYAPSDSEVVDSVSSAFPPMPPSQIEANKQLLKSMFTHAYDSYFYNAFPASELKPLTCQPGVFDLVKVPALTLIDTMDTMVIMRNYTEFARSVERLRYLDDKMKHEYQSSLEKSEGSDRRREGEEGGLFSLNVNVSLFETTIRVLGGLLSAHQMADAFLANQVSKSDVWDSSGEVLTGYSPASVYKDDADGSNIDKVHNKGKSIDSDSEGQTCLDSVEGGHECASSDAVNKKKERISTSSIATWEYDGFLLELAHDIGKRLSFAFDTNTGVS